MKGLAYLMKLRVMSGDGRIVNLDGVIGSASDRDERFRQLVRCLLWSTGKQD